MNRLSVWGKKIDQRPVHRLVIPRITDGKQMVMQNFFLGVAGGERGGKQGAS